MNNQFNEPQIVPSPQNHEIKVEDIDSLITDGKGLEVIQKIGYQEYRNRLANFSYSQFIQKVMDEKKRHEETIQSSSPTESKAPGWVITNANDEALKRTLQLGKELQTQFPYEGTSPFYVDNSRTNKIWVFGKDFPQTKIDEDYKMTRIYLSPPTANLPEAFSSLVNALERNGCLSQIQVALNLEVLEAESLNKDHERNSIIIYAKGDTPPMDKIAKAIMDAKNLLPSSWVTSERAQLELADEMARDFMIPLDSTTGLVEIRGEESYHNVRGRIAADLLKDFRLLRQKNIEPYFDALNPQTPGNFFTFDFLEERRSYMPGLVFNLNNPDRKP